MNARPRLIIASLLIISLAAPANASAAAAKTSQAAPGGSTRGAKGARGGRPDPANERYKPGEVIVRYRRGVKEERRAEIRTHAGLRRIKGLALTGSELAEIVDGSSVEKTIVRLQANPGVVSAQPNFVYRAVDLPNDEFFGHLWGLDNVGQYIGGSRTNGVGTADVDVDAPEAWAITMGDPEVVVGVIDTAIDVGHPDLAANVWTNPGEIAGDGVDNDHNGFVDDVHGWNFYDGTARTWTPGEGYHGTHVAGTIAALAGNGVGVAGVAPNVRIVQLQFLGPEGYGYTSDAVEALSYARTMGVRLTSNSWGGGGFDLELHDAICSSDGIFVAAAGNNSANADTSPLYPAAYDCPNIVSVAALTNTGALASFSNYGPTTVDVGAPGQDVLSTLPAGEYGFLSGTSMATPHVSGIAALMLSMQPGLGGAQVRELLIQTVKPLESLRGVTVSGGMASAVNAVHALELVTDPKDRAIEVPADKIITVTYIADVQAGTAFEAISLLRGDAPVAVTRTLAGKILQLVPVAPLAIDGIYTVIIPEGAVLDATGRALRAYSFSFKTHDTLPPAVVRTDPQDGGANAPGSQTITITLDEDVKAGGAFANVTLTTGGTAVPVSTSTDRNVFTIDPVYSLAKSSTYTVTAPAGALTDLSGNPLAAFTFSFSTALDVTPPRVVSCEPPPYSVEVPTTGDVVFDYTKNITLGAGATGISLGCLGEPGVFVSSTSANVLFLHPVRPLESSSLCLAWIPPGAVQDEFGNTNLEPNGVYFWTRDDRSPLRTSTNPADGATGVPAASAITASFDEDIVPGSSFDAITLKDEAGMSVPFSWSYPDDGYGFTYSNMLAFTPQDVLGSLRRYTLTVPAGAITDLSAQRNPAAGFQISFTTEQDVVRPRVTVTDPAMNAIEVPTGKTISVSFSEKVVPGSTYASIVLKKGTAGVPASLTLSGSQLLVSPAAPLQTDATYTLSVPAGAVADLVGNTLAADFTLTFSTPDTLPPRVIGSAPAPGATDVAVGSSIRITLSEDSFPGPAFAGLTLRDQTGNGIPVTSAFYEDEEGTINTYLIVTPAAPMSPNSVYTLGLPAGAVVDGQGNPSEPDTLSFSTPYPVVASDPAAGAIGVPLDKVITLSLLVPGTTGPSFGGIALKKGTTTVAATVTLSGALLTVQPSAALVANASYTLAVPAGAVVSSVGLPLAPFTLGFRTFDPDVPRVAWTDPPNGAAGVSIEAAVTVTYSESTVQGPAFGAITVKDESGTSVPIITDYPCDAEGCFDNVLVITPTAPLAHGTTYSVSLPAGALVDTAGNGSEAYAFSFVTQ